MISSACLSVDFGKIKNGVNIFSIDLLKCQEREKEPGKPRYVQRAASDKVNDNLKCHLPDESRSE